jgi:hypothetical protein
MNTSVFEKYESEVRSYCRNFPAVFTKAKGSYIFAEDGKEYIDKDFLVVGNKRNVAKVCQLFRIDYQMRKGELNLETTEYVKDDTAERLTEQLNKGRVLDNFLVDENRVDILQNPVAMNRLYSQALKEYRQKVAPQAQQPELEKNLENQPKEQDISAPMV